MDMAGYRQVRALQSDVKSACSVNGLDGGLRVRGRAPYQEHQTAMRFISSSLAFGSVCWVPDSGLQVSVYYHWDRTTDPAEVPWRACDMAAAQQGCRDRSMKAYNFWLVRTLYLLNYINGRTRLSCPQRRN